MTDLNQHILVRLIPDGECIGIRTYSREIGQRGRFLIIRDSLEEWLSGDRKRAFYDMDCGDMIKCSALPNNKQNRRNGEILGNRSKVTVFWANAPFCRKFGQTMASDEPAFDDYLPVFFSFKMRMRCSHCSTSERKPSLFCCNSSLISARVRFIRSSSRLL